jgi:hypothetical protein
VRLVATHDVNERVDLRTTLRDPDGTPTNATVVLTVYAPDGTTSTPALSNPSTGVYEASVLVDQAGEWAYRWASTGLVEVVDGGTFTVVDSGTPESLTWYCSLNEVREQLRDSDARLDEDLLRQAISAASEAIDDFCGRSFYLEPTAATRMYSPDDPYLVEVDDIGSTTGLIIKTDTAGDGTWATTWTSTDYQLEPINAGTRSHRAYSWTRIRAVGRHTFPTPDRRPTVQVTARFGWSRVPHAVTSACLLKAVSLFRRKDSPDGIAGFGEFGPVRIGRQDPHVMQLLSPYVRMTVGGV